MYSITYTQIRKGNTAKEGGSDVAMWKSSVHRMVVLFSKNQHLCIASHNPLNFDPFLWSSHSFPTYYSSQIFFYLKKIAEFNYILKKLT